VRRSEASLLYDRISFSGLRHRTHTARFGHRIQPAARVVQSLPAPLKRLIGRQPKPREIGFLNASS
jgi:hypothetical protein